MLFVVIIFFIAITTAFGMLSFRAWELRTGRVAPEHVETGTFEFSFRNFEQVMLHYTKHIIQGFVLVVVKYWFIGVTRVKIWLMDKWPKVHRIFQKKPKEPTPMKPTFFTKALMESKSKIKRIRQKVREDHNIVQ